MSKVIRVRYEKGVLKPLEKVELVEGEELEVIILRRIFRGFQEKSGRYKFRVERDLVGDFVMDRR